MTALEKHHPLLARERFSCVDLPDHLRRTRGRLRTALRRAPGARRTLSGYARLAASRRGTARRYRQPVRAAGVARGPFARRLSVADGRAEEATVGEWRGDARFARHRGLAQQHAARVAVDRA